MCVEFGDEDVGGSGCNGGGGSGCGCGSSGGGGDGGSFGNGGGGGQEKNNYKQFKHLSGGGDKCCKGSHILKKKKRNK